MNLPADLRYTPSHEWVRVENDIARIGITDFAQHELGDVVFLELPPVGRKLDKGSIFGAVESVKAVSDLYAPITGEVTAINEPLQDAPEKINGSPYEAGWMIEIRIADHSELDGLLDADAYAASTQG